jgi:pimeloyl-ACP methyl ester carboxylesterase
MPIPRRGYVDGPFGQIHYQFTGQGPTVVLLHQAPMTSGQFDNVYEPLARQGFQVIGVDMPGFGMSDPTPDAPTVDDYAEVVPPVLDAFGLSKAAVLGHHTGGLVATAAALRWPDRITALIVNGPLFVTDEERQDYLATGHQSELAFHAQPGGAHLAPLFAIREKFAAGTVDAERISNYIVQAMIGRGKYWYGHHAAYQYAHDLALAKVTQPTLILTNTGDVIHDSALKAKALRPDFAYVALDGGGVDIVDQQPEAWAAVVGQFLRDQTDGR